MSIEIIENKVEWDDFLCKVGTNYDCYHTFDYHQISKSNNDSPILIKYHHNNTLIGLPLLIREIEGTNYYDATSVYGYSGPVYNEIANNFDFEHYKKTLLDYFTKNNIVSVFSRLNPYLTQQNSLLNNFGELVNLGKIVNINLTLSLELQRQQYQRRLKSHVNKANRDCTVKKATSKEDFKIFKDLYFENMDRVDAKSFYYFNDEYFDNFIKSKDYKTETLLAYHNETGKAIGGSMFIKTNDIVQYHLSGASAEYLHFNAIKLLIDTMRIEATNEGFKTFNLGGGLGANQDDSLFKFKSTFSDEYHDFFVWKLIVNNEKYTQLCNEKNVSKVDSNFFPLYRYK